MAKKSRLPQTADEAFKKFLEEFSKGILYIYNDKVEVEKKDLEDTYKEFCDKSRDENGGDKKFDEVIDELKKIKKEETKKDKIIKIINLAIWLWALPNSRKSKWIEDKKEKTKGKKNKDKTTSTSEKENELKNELLTIPGVAGGGSGYVQYKTNGIRYILYLLKELYPKIRNNEQTDNKQTNNKGETLENIIQKLSRNDRYDNVDNGKEKEKGYPVPDGVRNLLLHLCESTKFAPIASTNDKEDIVKAFWECLEKDKPNNEEEALNDLDQTLFKIRDELEKLIKNNDESFKILYPQIRNRPHKMTQRSKR